MIITTTPNPPYFAVIFTSIRADSDNDDGYEDMAIRMWELAHEQPGFLGVESARQDVGITVSYWQDLKSISKWKANVDHQGAQKMGREHWYRSYRVRVCEVLRDYGLDPS